ncbi:MAG: 6-bladed beta-propeller, partial [Sulfurimonas sp.]|nr:6-bladed beta-propeller [Sulfurimonas sp.]
MKIIFLSVSVFVMLFFQACATKPVDVKWTITYPTYPEEPKILYLNTYRGGSKPDTSTALDLFLGEATRDNKSMNIVKPYGVGLQDGKVYVADSGSDIVFIIDEKTRDLNFIGDGMRGRLASPVGIAFGKDKTIYVSDSRLKTINGYDPQGNLKFMLGGRLEFNHPTGIAVDKNQNRLYVVDTKGHMFKAYDIATKKHLYSVGKRGVGDAEFNFPTNIAVDQRNGNIVIVDTQNFRIQIFDKDGKFVSRFGSIGDKPGTFARPKGVGIDSDGNIYVADSAFNNIQIFDEKGQNLLLYFGSAGYTEGRFRLVTGLYIDETDKIIIADGFSGRVQTFQYISEKWKKENPIRYKEIKEFGMPESEKT